MSNPIPAGQLRFAHCLLILLECCSSLVYPGFMCRGFEQAVGFGPEFVLDISEIGYAGTRGKQDLAYLSPSQDDFLSAPDQIGVINTEHGGKQVLVHAAKERTQL